MGQRDSIYLVSFIIAVVLLVGLFGLTYMVYSENEQLRDEAETATDEAKELKKTIRERSDQIDALKVLIAGDGKASVGTNEEERKAFLDREIAVATKAIQAAYKDLGQEASVDYTYLVEPYAAIEKLFTDYKELRDQFKANAKSSDAELTAKIADSDSTIGELNTRISALTREVADAQ
ncbi:MAG: hypothetical protein AAF517_01805, partial [Planctomycetota bacterium]